MLVDSKIKDVLVGLQKGSSSTCRAEEQSGGEERGSEAYATKGQQQEEEGERLPPVTAVLVSYQDAW